MEGDSREQMREEFEKWWTGQTKAAKGKSPRGRHFGCSENWGARDAWRAATARAYEKAANEADHLMCSCGRRNVGDFAARRIRQLAATEEAKK